LGPLQGAIARTPGQLRECSCGIFAGSLRISTVGSRCRKQLLETEQAGKRVSV
jgi:hypothetical protein